MSLADLVVYIFKTWGIKAKLVKPAAITPISFQNILDT